MIELRPVTENDTLFIETVYRSTREAELDLTNWSEQQKNVFSVMQSRAQLAEYKKNYPGAAFQIILYKQKPAGRLYIWENDSEIRLMDITLLPQFRSRGIGTGLLQDLIKKSNDVQKKISLHVEAANPALKLYKRLGFIRIKNNGRHYYMEKSPEIFSNPTQPE